MLWAPGKALRRNQRLSWGSQDKDGPDVELGEKVTPSGGNGVGGSATVAERTGHV